MKESSSWTPERRAAQAERARSQKPWTKSTGPRTKAGKKRVSKNAIKHGESRALLVTAQKALKLHRDFMRVIVPVLVDKELNAMLAEAQNKLNKSASKSSPLQQ